MAEEKKPEKRKPEYKRYELAATAAALPRDEGYKGMALSAMEEFYKACGMDKDPCVQRVFSDTIGALKAGQGYSAEFAQAIGLYAKKFDGEIAEGTVGDFIAYTGYTDIPAKLKELLSKYSEKSVKDLKKDNEDDQRVMAAIQLLRQNHVQGGLLTSLIKKTIGKSTKAGLEGLVAEE